ncbi:F-box domain-containing protein [Orpheovirus IHUMI-LCC2]|uniref:F-box domain-containing protein n=1 Tax=Orpheovirus IHUMI-LCC2 TaxID=2023057 RepID=A0A2I2L506_9VIRU|nr:F-box domain-containing protein [Orpheovirus IHUMI-LCC2]SNW62632.1 F-box domain-containing protein [Orpheovirus IHUMI-LCC2]
MQEDNIPQEILLNIFQYLSTYDLSNALQISKYYNNLCKDDKLWRSLYRDTFMRSNKIIDNIWYKNYLYIVNIFPLKCIYAINKYKKIYNFLSDITSIINIGKYEISSSHEECSLDKIGIYIYDGLSMPIIFGINAQYNKIYILGCKNGNVSTYGTIGSGSNNEILQSLYHDGFYIDDQYNYILFDNNKVEFLKKYKNLR